MSEIIKNYMAPCGEVFRELVIGEHAYDQMACAYTCGQSCRCLAAPLYDDTIVGEL